MAGSSSALVVDQEGGGGFKYKTVSIGNHNFSSMCILNKDFFHAKMTP